MVEEKHRAKLVEICNKAAIHLIECNTRSISVMALYLKMEKIAEDIRMDSMLAMDKFNNEYPKITTPVEAGDCYLS